MKEALMKLQIESLEQQLKVLKSKIISKKEGKSFADLYGIFEGKMDLFLEEMAQQKNKKPGKLTIIRGRVFLVYFFLLKRSKHQFEEMMEE